MAPGRQEPDLRLWCTRSAAARVPSASGLRWRPLGAGVGWAARLAGCGRVATAEAGASEAVAVARRGSRGGSSGGGGCTGGGGRDSITHLHTHRGRSLDSSKPRHGADTLSSLDLAGASPARLVLLDAPPPTPCQNQRIGAVAELETQTQPRTQRRSWDTDTGTWKVVLLYQNVD